VAYKRATSPIIYSLHDPITDELRYIGYSTVSPANRLGHHLGHALEGSTTLCASWIRDLMAEGRYPVIRVVKQDATHADEVEAIATQRAAGARLLNVADGGKGARGVKRSPEERARASERAKARDWAAYWTPERRAAASAARKGVKNKPRTPEHIANLVAANTGKKRTVESRRKMSAARIGKPGPNLNAEQRARRSVAVARSWIERKRRARKGESE
jgi:hypothetical protein